MQVLFRFGSLVLLTGTLILLAGCDFFLTALPPRPSPFPTLARLPSVTPVLPSRTPAPTFTPLSSGQQHRSKELTATVAIGANLRATPSLNGSIVVTLPKGQQVSLLSRAANWYQVATQDGLQGWMAAEVLELDAEVLTAVPTTSPPPKSPSPSP